MKAQRKISKVFPNVKVILNEKEAGKLDAFISHQTPIRTESLLIKIKNAYKSKFEKSMMAATFAEAGEFETVKNIFNELD